MNTVAHEQQKRGAVLPWAVPATLILVGLALRLFRLGADSIWYDEGVSLYLSRLSIPALVAHTAGDIHPPFYYILLHLWRAVVGPSQFAAAFLSTVCGVLLIPLTHSVARCFFGPRVAATAALLVALSPYHLWYSQEMRMYTLGALLGLGAFFFLWQAMTSRRFGARAWVGYVVCAVLGLYTLYYFAFLLVFVAVAVPLVAWVGTSYPHPSLSLAGRGRLPPPPVRGRDEVRVAASGDVSPSALSLAGKGKAWLVAHAAIAMVYLPWLPVAVRQAVQPPVPPWRAFTGLGTLLAETWTALCLGQSVQTGDVWPVLALVGLVYVLGLAWPDRARPSAWLLAGYTFVPVALIYVVSLVTPLYHVRYIFLYAPAFAIVLARGLHIVWQKTPAVSVLALVVIVLAMLRSAQAYFYDPAYAPDDHRSAVRFINEQARPGDALLINAGYAYPTFLYYYKGDLAWRGRLTDFTDDAVRGQQGLVVLQTGTIGGARTLGWGSPASDFYATTEAETAAALDRVAQHYERLWVLRIYDTVTDPQGFIRRYLDERFLLLDDAGFGGKSSMRVQLYRTYRTPRTVAPPLANAMHVNLGNHVRLLGYDVSGELRPGETAFLTTLWQALAPQANLRAFALLTDQAGREWAHWDDMPGGRLYPTTRWAAGEVVRQVWRLELPFGVPAGPYRLGVGLYDADSGRRLDVLDAGGRPTGTVAHLGNVQVGKQRTTVDVAALPVQTRLNALLGDEVRLVGYSVNARLRQPGERVEVTVYWQGVKPVDEGRIVFVQLLDRPGKLWAAAEGPPAATWEADQVLADRYSLLLPADAPDGEMRLIIGVYRAADKQRLPVRQGLLGRGDHVRLGTVRVAGRTHSFGLPAMTHRVQAVLGDEAVLLGYDLSPDSPVVLARNSRLRVTLYWQATGSFPMPMTVFVQLLAVDGRIAGQDDTQPGRGLLPTTGWVKGEVLTDVHDVVVRADASPGTYRLVVGMYDPVSGARLPVRVNGVRQADDMVVLETVVVR